MPTFQQCIHCHENILIIEDMMQTMPEITCHKCYTVQKNNYYIESVNKPVNELVSNDVEIKYNRLCAKQSLDKSNNDYLTTFEELLGLGDYKDVLFRCKQCLDNMSFNNADELMFLGRCYTKIGSTLCTDIGEKCISVAEEWKSVEDKELEFIDKYSSRPKLLKLWDKHSTLIIIAGVVTLLWGFIVYFGAVLLEKIMRTVYCSTKKSTDEYKLAAERLEKQKAKVKEHLSELNDYRFAL